MTWISQSELATDPVNMTVTLNLINGFSFGKLVWYISETSLPLGAAIERNTSLPCRQRFSSGGDDTFSRPIERIFIATNGPEEGGCANPLGWDCHPTWRTVFGLVTLSAEYRPMRWITAQSIWDAQLFEWT